MKKKSMICLVLLIIAVQFAHAQQYADVYPTNWWVNMKWNQVQLILRGTYDGFSNENVQISYPGVSVQHIHKFSNGKYLAVDLFISPETKPGTVNIVCTAGKKTHTIPWEIKQRRQGNGTMYAQGVTSSDFIYLLMPDRFSNGDTSNDHVAGMLDQSLNRDSIYLRHGGDLQGVINHLDYLQKLGVTTLWMTPVIENDMPTRTEHGYAFTDHYKIDPRIGGDAAYIKLSDALHAHGMKLIQDAVYNHIGLKHWIMQDPPESDWLHQWPSYTQTSFKDQPLMDPYASANEKRITSDGWFVPSMPDLNQGNPYVVNFLIQHAIWSVEEFGVDGWRIDTYIYNDLDFMNKCNSALITEYPHITMFGETWVHGTANQAYFAQNNLDIPFKSNLMGVTDFQMNFYGINAAMTQDFGWTDGVSKLYTTLSNDFLYKDATRNVIFLDNHDMSRFFSQVNENVTKQKTGIKWLLTCRGIPEMYYGTEVLMKGYSNPDGLVRLDFPGGWTGDAKDAFTGAGLTNDEKSVQDLTMKLAGFRKTSSALKTGKLMQYVPQNGLYVYFRYDVNQTIMCIMNAGKNAASVDFSKYTERTSGFTTATDVVTGQTIDMYSHPQIEAYDMMVLELK